MNTKPTLKFMLACLLFLAPLFSVVRAEGTRMDAFVGREKQQQVFRSVPGLWKPDPSIPVQLADEHVKNASFLLLDHPEYNIFMGERNPAIVLHVPMADGRIIAIELVRYDHTASGFKLQAVTGDQATDIAYTSGLHYCGVVAGVPGSIASFSFFNDNLYGIFSLPEGGNFVIAPNQLLPEASRPGSYILYNDSDLVNKDAPSCGTDMLPSLEDIKGGATPAANVVYSSCRELSIYYQADYATYQSFGGNVNSVGNYVSYMHNVVATLYRNEGLSVVVKLIQVNIVSDAYQSLGNSSLFFLQKFGDITRNSMNGADAAVLLSTRHGSQMGGVAWLNALCSNYNLSNQSGPYAFANISRSTNNPFPTYTWDASMVAHEIGHLIGSRHTHSCTWPGGPIDGCRPPEDGNCTRPVPNFPAGGGTIMSYCHIGGTVNFTKGFGPLPGDLLRNNMSTVKSCVSEHLVNKPLSSEASSLTANCECTDATGLTYYYNDNNTADRTDDRLVLKVRKNNNDIGTVDDPGFFVKSFTNAGLGSGSGLQIALPPGTPGRTDDAYAARRYFTFQPVTQPASEMDFVFALHLKDTLDLSGNISGPLDWSYLNLYTVSNTSVSPDPANGLNGITSNDLDIYTHSSASSNTTWFMSSYAPDSVLLFNFRSADLAGGTVYMNVPYRASVQGLAPDNRVQIYPNPATDQWTIQLPVTKQGGQADFLLYATDGRVVTHMQLEEGSLNQVPAASLSPGIYFFRISSAGQAYTGVLERK